jgi:hypothetical protein
MSTEPYQFRYISLEHTTILTMEEGEPCHCLQQRKDVNSLIIPCAFPCAFHRLVEPDRKGKRALDERKAISDRVIGRVANRFANIEYSIHVSLTLNSSCSIR